VTGSPQQQWFHSLEGGFAHSIALSFIQQGVPKALLQARLRAHHSILGTRTLEAIATLPRPAYFFALISNERLHLLSLSSLFLEHILLTTSSFPTIHHSPPITRKANFSGTRKDIAG
jgi:hypothetical protein